MFVSRNPFPVFQLGSHALIHNHHDVSLKANRHLHGAKLIGTLGKLNVKAPSLPPEISRDCFPPAGRVK